MSWGDSELLLISLAAMLSPTTLSFSVLALVLGDRPLRTGLWWVAVVDVIAGALLLVAVVRFVQRPADPEKAAGMIKRMSAVASSPAIAIVGAGAMLANAGGFIPLALKSISEQDPSKAQYVAYWVGFTLVSLLPLSIAIVMLLVSREPTVRRLNAARDWLVLHARTVAATILVVLAAVLLRNGIAGLT